MHYWELLDDMDFYGSQEYQKLNAIQELIKTLRNTFFDLNSLKVLEVSAGDGILTRKLLPLVKEVTAVDPKLNIEEEYSNLKKDYSIFNCEKYNCDKFDVIVACAPCEATEHIIRASNKSNKKFFIILCRCMHPTIEGDREFNNRDERFKYLKEQVKSKARLYEDEYKVCYLTNM